MRLVAFGCSLTSGYSLDNPKTESWPGVLSSMLGYDTFVNNGVSKYNLY
jgi:lysophospholipase L1-like esterase